MGAYGLLYTNLRYTPEGQRCEENGVETIGVSYPQVVCHELCIYTVGVLNTWQLSVIITPANIIKTCPVQSFFLFKRIVTFPTFYGTTHGSSYKPHAPMSTKY